MANPDSLRPLNDERALAESEAALAREEQALWQRVEALAAGSFEPRAQSLLARLEALEQGGAASPDLTRAKTVVQGAAAPEATPAQSERAAAVTARREALKAREAAVKALTAALGQSESLRQKRKKDLDAVEAFVAGTEAALKQYLEQQRRQAEEAAAAKAAAETAVAPPPPPAPIPVTPKAKKAPAPPPPVVEEEAPAAPEPTPVVERKPAKAPAASVTPIAAQPKNAAAKKQAGAPARKVSRRRRVRLAPPPRKLEVEVAVYGENNFYTGFENKIGSGGIFVASHETLPPGHELEVEIDLEGRKISTRGRVEFARVDNPISSDCTPGAGVKLLNLSGENAAAIESFFQKRPPMFFTAVQ